MDATGFTGDRDTIAAEVPDGCSMNMFKELEMLLLLLTYTETMLLLILGT